DAPAREAVASGVERGPGDDEIRLVSFHKVEDRPDGVVLVLAEEVVAAEDGADDVGRAAECALKCLTRPDGAVLALRTLPGLLFAANSGKKLIHVVHHAKLGHLSTPSPS